MIIEDKGQKQIDALESLKPKEQTKSIEEIFNFNYWKCWTRTRSKCSKNSDEQDKDVTLKNCAPFTKCISRINNTDTDNAQDIDIVMPMYNLIEYSDNYSKTSGSLWQYYKDV